MSDPVEYKVVTPLRIYGKRHEPDATVMLDQEWAAVLLKNGVVREALSADTQDDAVVAATRRALIDLIKAGQDPEAMTVKAVNEATGLKLKKADIEASLIDGDCHVTALAELHSVDGVVDVIDHISSFGDQVVDQDGAIDPDLVADSYEESQRPAEQVIATAITAINLNHEIGGNE